MEPELSISSMEGSSDINVMLWLSRETAQLSNYWERPKM
jgi:hypothetical protein